MRHSRAVLCALLVLPALVGTGLQARERFLALQLTAPNPSGLAVTIHQSGAIDLDNAFFRPLGTNGRTCDSCHRVEDGWSITPESVRRRFDASNGTDPIFATNDGSNSPVADVSTSEARRTAYSMLLAKAVIRVGLPIPANAEFELQSALDPYGFASASELSLFRRPLPATNLRFLGTVMWDGRETVVDELVHDCVPSPSACFAPLELDLANQANGATVGHAQAAHALSDAERAEIVNFEMGLFTAQAWDASAGYLFGPTVTGGTARLTEQDFHVGINDFVRGDFRDGEPFDERVFTLFGAWANSGQQRFESAQAKETRRSIARGEMLFNARRFSIDGVAGFNDVLGVSAFSGTCSTCHDVPNAGSASVFGTLDIGVSAITERTPDLPLYVLRNRTTGQRVATTDPGRAMITGRWADINRFKVPTLRGLAARAPYFHNGSAADVEAVVDFYDRRFQMHLTPTEAADLAAFLRAL